MNKALVAREEKKKPYMQNIKDVHQVLESLVPKQPMQLSKERMNGYLRREWITVNPMCKLDERIAECVQFVHKT